MIERYASILKEIQEATTQAGREPGSVKLIAVSKTHPYSSIRELYDAGQRDFGENYVQELIEKAEQAIADGLTAIRWHFIGHLQTNKVKSLLPFVHTIHGVGTLRLAQEIDKRADKKQIVPIFIEVNIDQEESKSGVRAEDLRTLAEAINSLDHLALHGLMCIPNPERTGGARAAFHETAQLESDLSPLSLGALSMGMTSDFKDAIAEGATYVRVGTALFGERPTHSAPTSD
ncbi:MAG: YggS family pyridoxal phosphate-dependent enzyme [Cryobacterium sp.]|nr:YggS family pyridoxal phosphate-dependent enzyme [Oligoflexia bacterium]